MSDNPLKLRKMKTEMKSRKRKQKTQKLGRIKPY
jgi:hypothetical protein